MRKDWELVSIIQTNKHSLVKEKDLDALIDYVGDAKIVMLGEASHGTHEYYRWRSLISKRLIEEKGFNFIAVEGDWPPCYVLNRFIKNYKDVQKDIQEVLQTFDRWPTWMWANWEIAALSVWLWKYNLARDPYSRIGFYGLDVYSLQESLAAILNYLEQEDPEAAKVAKEAIHCFEPYLHEEDGQKYAWATYLRTASCENKVVNLLQEIRAKLPQYDTDIEAPFSTAQNALVAVNAERYYRAMVKLGPESWNIRDYHMMETLNRLLQFHGKKAKAIVWEHNTHIGDARFTDMRDDQMINIGQLGREQYGKDQVKLVGFGSYQGSVMAGRAWGAQQEVMQVPAAREGSWEKLLHETSPTNFYLLMDEIRDIFIPQKIYDHRAIGVVYHPDREQYGNYVPSQIDRRYDVFIYYDQTQALHPIKHEKKLTKMPETYPWGF
jgi:erythromycin esterase-like protein